jgi:hypothetical protein
MASIRCTAIVLSALILSVFLSGADIKPVAWWKFDQAKGSVAVDSVSGKEDSIRGYYEFADGVDGRCLRFDGYTTAVARQADGAPLLESAFTIEAWVAPQTYAWDWAAIVNQEKEHRAGFFFGLDVTGHIGLHLAINGKWVECNSTQSIPLLKWSHVAATFDKNAGVRLYIKAPT